MDQEITLLAAARQMNKDTLTEIFDLYTPVLHKYALRLYKDAGVADQLVGDVFERFVQQLSAGQNPGVNLRMYLYEMAYSFVVCDGRYLSYLLSTDRAAPRHQSRWPTDLGVDDQRLLDALQWAILHDLKNDQRHVIILRFMEGFSSKETAAIMRKKINNVKVIQNRAIAALHKALVCTLTETPTITILLRRMAEV